MVFTSFVLNCENVLFESELRIVRLIDKYHKMPVQGLVKVINTFLGFIVL